VFYRDTGYGGVFQKEEVERNVYVGSLSGTRLFVNRGSHVLSLRLSASGGRGVRERGSLEQGSPEIASQSLAMTGRGIATSTHRNESPRLTHTRHCEGAFSCDCGNPYTTLIEIALRARLTTSFSVDHLL
jgi:hypothetical protein